MNAVDTTRCTGSRYYNRSAILDFLFVGHIGLFICRKWQCPLKSPTMSAKEPHKRSCRCFRSEVLCTEDCVCSECYNDGKHEEARLQAIRTIRLNSQEVCMCVCVSVGTGWECDLPRCVRVCLCGCVTKVASRRH